MIKLRALLVLGLMGASAAQAKDIPFSLDNGTSYPSPAADHLAFAQADIARKAIEVCGGIKKLVGVTALQITVLKGVNDPVAVLAQGSTEADANLDLWYPQIKAKAVARCKD
jgi:hypothetical protein